MNRNIALAILLGLGSCPPAVDVPERTSSSGISYCSGGMRWLPGHSSPSGPCQIPAQTVTAPGDTPADLA